MLGSFPPPPPPRSYPRGALFQEKNKRGTHWDVHNKIEAIHLGNIVVGCVVAVGSVVDICQGTSLPTNSLQSSTPSALLSTNTLVTFSQACRCVTPNYRWARQDSATSYSYSLQLRETGKHKKSCMVVFRTTNNQAETTGKLMYSSNIELIEENYDSRK